MKATIRQHPVSFMTSDLDLAQAIHERIDYYRRNRTDLHDLCEKYEAQLSSARDELITLTHKHSFISPWKTSARREFLEIKIETLKDEVESAPKRIEFTDKHLSRTDVNIWISANLSNLRHRRVAPYKTTQDGRYDHHVICGHCTRDERRHGHHTLSDWNSQRTKNTPGTSQNKPFKMCNGRKSSRTHTMLSCGYRRQSVGI